MHQQNIRRRQGRYRVSRWRAALILPVVLLAVGVLLVLRAVSSHFYEPLFASVVDLIDWAVSRPTGLPA